MHKSSEPVRHGLKVLRTDHSSAALDPLTRWIYRLTTDDPL
jgi:hypothetical protein